jgi:hypothetical protein
MLGGNPRGAIYGTVVATAIIAATAGHESPEVNLVATVATLLVFWLAHVYADFLDHRLRQAEFDLKVVPAIMAKELSMLAAPTLSILFLLLGARHELLSLKSPDPDLHAVLSPRPNPEGGGVAADPYRRVARQRPGGDPSYVPRHRPRGLRNVRESGADRNRPTTSCLQSKSVGYSSPGPSGSLVR